MVFKVRLQKKRLHNKADLTLGGLYSRITCTFLSWNFYLSLVYFCIRISYNIVLPPPHPASASIAVPVPSNTSHILCQRLFLLFPTSSPPPTAVFLPNTFSVSLHISSPWGVANNQHLISWRFYWLQSHENVWVVTLCTLLLSAWSRFGFK